MIIHMKGFSGSVSKQDIKSLFETYGPVKRVIKSPRSAYVNMPDKERAEIAISNLDKMKWRGWTLRVKPRKANSKSSVCRTPLGVMRLF